MRNSGAVRKGVLHLKDVGGAETLRLLVDVVAADALENQHSLHRFERLPLLKEGALQRNKIKTTLQQTSRRLTMEAAVSTCSTETFSVNTECSSTLSEK